MAALEIRMAEDEAGAILAFRAYQKMHEEGCVPGSLHPMKTLTNLMRFVHGPGSVVLLAMDGDELAGVLTLVESTYWYSEDDKWLCDKGLYVLPEHRGGGAMGLLLEAAATIGDDTGFPVFIFINNGQRRRGRQRHGRFVNRGAILAHIPEK